MKTIIAGIVVLLVLVGACGYEIYYINHSFNQIKSAIVVVQTGEQTIYTGEGALNQNDNLIYQTLIASSTKK